MMSINLSNIAVLKIKNADYHCIITGISKGEAIKLYWRKWIIINVDVDVINVDVITLLEIVI